MGWRPRHYCTGDEDRDFMDPERPVVPPSEPTAPEAQVSARPELAAFATPETIDKLTNELIPDPEYQREELQLYVLKKVETWRMRLPEEHRKDREDLLIGVRARLSKLRDNMIATSGEVWDCW